MLSLFLIELVVDVTELDLEYVLSYLLNADDIILMSQTIKGLRNKFLRVG